MGGFAQRTAAALVGVSLLLTACGKSSSPASSSHATVPPAAPTTTTPADPYAIPPTIDAAYLDRVLAALERVNGDAARLIITNRSVVPDASQRLIAIYAEQELRAQTSAWLDLVSSGLQGFKPRPGDIKSTVSRVVSLKPDCIYLQVERDFNDIRTDPKPPSTDFVVLRPADPVRNAAGLNPTPWLISSESYNRDGSMPADPCVG